MTTMTPDMLVLIAVIAAVVLDFVVPLGFEAGLTEPVTWAGIPMALGGFALEIAAARALVRSGTTARANGEPTVLVTTGPYARSRNPFYIGLLLILLGLLLAVGFEWGIATTVGVWVALDRIVVPQEEEKLRALAPEAYERYSRAVRRWL